MLQEVFRQVQIPSKMKPELGAKISAQESGVVRAGHLVALALARAQLALRALHSHR